MKEHGINLIVADSAEEIENLRKILGVTSVSALKSLEQMVFVDPDTVFFSVLRTKKEMEKLFGFFTVKRGVMSYGGHRDLVGFNVDWVKKILASKKSAELPKPIVIPQPEEKDDPYTDLGYRR